MKREAIVSFLLVGLFLVSMFPMRTLSGEVDTDGGSKFLRAQSMAAASGSVGYWYARFFTLGDIVIFSYKDGLTVSIYNSTGTLLITQSLNKGNHYLYHASTLGVYSTIGNQEYSVLVGDPTASPVMGYFAANDSYYGVANEFYTYVASDQDVITFAYNTGITNVNVENWTGFAWSTLSTFSLTGPGDHYLNSSWRGYWLHFTSNKPISVECYSDRCFSVPAESGLWAGTHFYMFSGWYGGGDNIHVHSYKNGNMITVKYIGASTIWTGTLNDGEWKNIDRSLIGTSKYVEVTSNDTVTVSDEPYFTSDYYGLLAVSDQSGTGVGTRFYTYARESPPSGVGDIWIFPYEKNTNVTIKDMTTGGTTVWTGALNLNEYHQFTPSAGTGGHLFGIFSDDVVSVIEGSGPNCGAAFVPLVPPPRGRYATIPTNDGKHFKNDVFWDWIKGNFTKGNYKDMTFVFGECYGGGFVNSLPITDLPNMAVMSASAWNEPSYGAPPGPETPNDYDTFLQGVTDALRTNPTNTFDQIFSDSKSRDIANPDSPNFWGGSAKEHPQISPWSGNNMRLHDGVSNYAIMFAGDPNGLRHWNDLARMYNVMTTSLGYAASDITVLYGDGTGKMPNGTQSPVAVSASATLANLQNTIINVANKMNPNGTLLFWVSDHGDLDEGILDKTAVVNAYGTYQFQFNLDPEYIQAVSLSTSSPYVEIAHQGVTSNNTVVINNVPVGSLDSLSNTTTIPFSTNITFSPFDNTFTIISYQGTNFTISNITLTSGSVPTQQPVHDVAITNVMSSKTVVGQNLCANISVTVANQGSWTEAFNATLYAESQTTMNQTAINQTGLVGYWKFDEGSGTIASDSSGNNNHGTINGAVWTGGRIGSALQFDGIDDYVQVPDSAGLNITNDEISIAAWVKMLGDGTNNGVIVCKQAPAGASDASYSLDVYPSIHYPVGRHVEFAVNVGGNWNAYVSTSALNLSTWNHIVGTYDGSKVRIFINGVLDTEYTLAGNIVPKNGPLYISHEDAWSPGEYFNGTIDEVKIYNRTLSADEIWAEYTNAGLVGYWKFDEGSGTTAYDSSGNGNNGTLVNGPNWVNGKIGKALSFDGIDDYVQVPDSTSLNLTGDITIATWVKFNAIPSTMATLVSKDEGPGYTHKWLFAYVQNHTGISNALVFHMAHPDYGGVWLRSTAFTPAIGQWYHIAIVKSNNNYTFYINGGNHGENSTAYTLPSVNAPVEIGRANEPSENYDPFNGIIDEVKISNRALPAEEIWTEYARAPVAIGTQPVTLESGASKTLTFTWNTTGLAKGNYTLKAVADTVPGETNVSNNINFTVVAVSIVGDITGPSGWPDSKVDIRDVSLVARNFGKTVPPAPSNCDITGPIAGVPDGKVDIRDVSLVARNFGQKDP